MEYKTFDRELINKLINTRVKGNKSKVKFHLIPYFNINRSNGKDELCVFTMVKNSKITPFNFTTGEDQFSNNEEITTYIHKCLNEETFGTFSDVTTDHLHDVYYIIKVVKNALNRPVISGDCFAFFYMGSGPSSYFKDIIYRYTINYREELLNLNQSGIFNNNLVYIPELTLREMCEFSIDKKATYTLINFKTNQEYEIKISDGVFVRQEMLDLYNRKGKINYNGTNRSTANFPPSLNIYSSVIDSFSIQYMDLDNCNDKFIHFLEESDETTPVTSFSSESIKASKHSKESSKSVKTAGSIDSDSSDSSESDFSESEIVKSVKSKSASLARKDSELEKSSVKINNFLAKFSLDKRLDRNSESKSSMLKKATKDTKSIVDTLDEDSDSSDNSEASEVSNKTEEGSMSIFKKSINKRSNSVSSDSSDSSV